MSTIDPLRQCLADVAQCSTRAAVSSVAMSAMRRVFGVHAGAVVFFDAALNPLDVTSQGIRDVNHEEYVQEWRDRDPVLAAMLERRLPVHCGQLHSAESWRALPFIQHYGRRSEVESYMVAPIYGLGTVQGAFCFFRRRNDRAFGGRELELATVFSGVLSSAFASLPLDAKADAVSLTIRERQMAVLAGQGYNNPEIAAQLGVARETVKQTLRRVYSKLGVRGRAGMAAQLVRRGWI